MPQLVSVQFKYNPKHLWFDPAGAAYEAGSEVLVETERGREVGVVVDPCVEATDKQISKLKSPLKPVIRALNELDFEHLEVLKEKGRNALPAFRELVERYELDMKPVDVQYLFSGERAVFYFSSDERVDFRDLVRELAQTFHVRVDMRQIGARDEAMALGGIATCGQEYCCTRMGGDFQQVTIRMAKEQDLPLNPAKISGVCGRLMCCLRYEYETYKDFKKRAPKKGTPVDTPLGQAVVSGHNTPGETMELRLEDGKRFNVPLAEMDCQKEGEHCVRCCVGIETIERCASRSMLIALGSLDLVLNDPIATAHEAYDTQDARDAAGRGEGSLGGRKRRRRTGGGARSESGSGDGGGRGSRDGGSRDGGGNGGSCGRGSGGSGERAESTSRERTAQHAHSHAHSQQPTQAQDNSQGSGRKRRRRGEGGSAAKHSAAPSSQQQAQDTHVPPASSSQSSSASPSQNSEERPRPGQRSSGLRKRRTHSSPPPERASSSGAEINIDTSAGTDQRRRRQHRGSGNSSAGSAGGNSAGNSAGPAGSNSNDQSNSGSAGESPTQ